MLHSQKKESIFYTFMPDNFVVCGDSVVVLRPVGVIADVEDEDHRIKRVAFHVRSDDYFATLATVIDLIRQKLISTLKLTDSSKRSVERLEKLKDDLVHLQKNYQIEKKQKK